MDDHSFMLFNKRPEDMRRIGARGGRAAGRMRRARRGANLTLMRATPELTLHDETAAEAIATLDAKFPWLVGAEKRRG
jgi:hypothetical protein